MYSDVEYNSQLGACDKCGDGKRQRKMSYFGTIAFYSLWWCGLGFLILKMTSFDYCENCYFVDFMSAGKLKRTFTLVMDDKSLIEPPPLNAAEVNMKFDKNLLK